MEPKARLPHGQHKKGRTRRALEATALRLFAERGFDAVTVEEIADTADVSRRTFLRYFASKEDILFSDHARHMRRLETLLDQRPADEPVLASVRAALLGLAELMEEEREQVLARGRIVLLTLSLYGRALEVYTLFEEAIAEAVALRWQADKVRDLRVRLLAGIAATVLRQALLQWVLGGGPRPLPAVVDEAFGLASEGLARLDPQAPPSPPTPRGKGLTLVPGPAPP